MATTESITTTYAGESAKKWISAALLSPSTIENGGVEVMPNIKFQSVIHRLAATGLTADATCDFTDTGTVTMTEKLITPKNLQVNVILCKANYRDTWQAIEMGLSAHDNLPKSFADYLLGQVVAEVAAQNETFIWSGVEATDGQFGGLETKLTVDAGLPAAQEVAGATVTAANVLAELDKVLAAVPAAVYNKEDFNIYIPTNIKKHFIAAQAALGYLDRFHVGQTDMNFQGIPLFHAPGMTDDIMIAAQASNLYFGTGILADTNEVKLIDTAETLGDDNVRIVMRYTAAAEYGVVEDIVTYGITNAAN